MSAPITVVLSSLVPGPRSAEPEPIEEPTQPAAVPTSTAPELSAADALATMARCASLATGASEAAKKARALGGEAGAVVGSYLDEVSHRMAALALEAGAAAVAVSRLPAESFSTDTETRER